MYSCGFDEEVDGLAARKKCSSIYLLVVCWLRIDSILLIHRPQLVPAPVCVWMTSSDAWSTLFIVLMITSSLTPLQRHINLLI